MVVCSVVKKFKLVEVLLYLFQFLRKDIFLGFGVALLVYGVGGNFVKREYAVCVCIYVLRILFLEFRIVEDLFPETKFLKDEQKRDFGTKWAVRVFETVHPAT